MKAAIHETYGDPAKVLKIRLDAEMPTVGEKDVLVKVISSSVNRTDCGFIRAKPFITRLFSGLIRPRKKILGCTFAGIVEKTGPNVSDFKLGDRVFGFDDTGWGGHGKYLSIPDKRMLANIPDGIDFESAGVACEGGHYALSYMWALGIEKNSRVLVHGATGAIGSAAVQLFKGEGAYVVATSTTKSIEKIRELGADKVIDWEKSNFDKIDEQFDFVFDSVGKSNFKDCKNILKERGVYCATELGKYGQNPLLAVISPVYKLFGLKRVVFPLPKSNKKVINFLTKCLEEKTLTPLIDRTYSLDEIVDAYKYVEAGNKVGNVVIKVQ